MIKKLIYILMFFIVSVYLSSCATAPPLPAPPPAPPGPRTQIVHTVAPGETFWRISKMYDVPVATIMQVNNLKDPHELRMGQKLRIPDAAPIKPIVTLYPSRKWKYIIIHHSATDEGSSLSFHHAHLQKGWDKGVGYHFVVDNATNYKQDGEIETTPRWIKQQDGAHCKASDMNTKAIGICIVGNFSVEKVSRKQMDSLVYLVSTLRKYYRIPARNILRHGEIRGATTACPGSRFPWKELKNRLR